MAVSGWIVDKSAAARFGVSEVRSQLEELAGSLYVCPVGELEQRYSARSAGEYDRLAEELRAAFPRAEAPSDILDRALALQQDLAHHQGMWHRTAIPDLLIAETALHNRLGVVHVDRDFERIAEVRPLTTRRIR
ncbi:MAG: PIN domain-containing protein [Actinobacteria bacterium]|nr:PIN domain-containing protein [Actinomycetota bacterium]